jgi:hypothetical protein
VQHIWDTLYLSKYLGWKTVGWSLERLKFGRKEKNEMGFTARQRDDWIHVGKLAQKLVAPSHGHGNESSDSENENICSLAETVNASKNVSSPFI